LKKAPRFYRRALLPSTLTICVAIHAFLFGARISSAQTAGFTIAQALSAPFTSHLRAAGSKSRLAWVANIDGRRNIWVAEPSPEKTGYVSRPITHYADDDGQELSAPEWAPDAESIVYVRGEGTRGESHPVPNPAWFPKGAQQQIWIVGADSGEPTLLADGAAPAISPNGKTVAYILKGQLWTVSLQKSGAKPEQLVQTRGSAENLRWSPDGSKLAFVSSRGDHSFIAVYSFSSNSIT
jgi:Tol biopolymer transport system component